MPSKTLINSSKVYATCNHLVSTIQIAVLLDDTYRDTFTDGKMGGVGAQVPLHYMTILWTFKNKQLNMHMVFFVILPSELQTCTQICTSCMYCKFNVDVRLFKILYSIYRQNVCGIKYQENTNHFCIH